MSKSSQSFSTRITVRTGMGAKWDIVQPAAGLEKEP